MTELAEAEHALKDAEARVIELKHRASHQDYPKWVTPHDSHIDRINAHVSCGLFPLHHVDREGHVTVWVGDAEEEAKALAAREAHSPT